MPKSRRYEVTVPNLAAYLNHVVILKENYKCPQDHRLPSPYRIRISGEWDPGI